MFPEIKSIMVTITITPNRIIPTRSQDRPANAKINGVPIPPAPITPNIVAERTLISNRYAHMRFKICGITCGITANQMICCSLFCTRGFQGFSGTEVHSLDRFSRIGFRASLLNEFQVQVSILQMIQVQRL